MLLSRAARPARLALSAPCALPCRRPAAPSASRLRAVATRAAADGASAASPLSFTDKASVAIIDLNIKAVNWRFDKLTW
jgi:hypothetical protein